MPPPSNHDRQKRRRGILGGRIEEHFLLQRLEISRSVACLRIAQLDLDGSPAPVVLDDQIDLKALLVAEIMDAVVDAAVGGKDTRTRALERTYWLVVSRASSSESPRFAGQPPLQHQRATSSCEITPFSMQFLRHFQCRFYARHPWRDAYSTTGSPNCPDSGTRFPLETPTGNGIPFLRLDSGMQFPPAETMSRNECSKTGRSFQMACLAESVSQNRGPERDRLSV